MFRSTLHDASNNVEFEVDGSIANYASSESGLIHRYLNVNVWLDVEENYSDTAVSGADARGIGADLLFISLGSFRQPAANARTVF